MRNITSSAEMVPSGTYTRRSIRWAGFGLALMPLLAGAGAVIDFLQVAQFRTELENLANEAAIEGAMVYVDRASAGEARAVATGYFHSKHPPLSGQAESPHVKISATPAAAYGQKGYGVTVEVTAKPSHWFPAVLAPVQTVSISAFAINPIDPVNYAQSNFRIEAKSDDKASLAILNGG